MVRLEKITKSDFYKIVEWNKNKTSDFLHQWAGREYKFPLSINQINEKYTQLEINKNGSQNFSYKLLINENTMIGCISLFRINYEKKHGTIGKFLIGENKYRNKGYGKQAINEILEIAFNKLTLNKVRLSVYDFNHSAINCYESLGFMKDTFYKDVFSLESGQKAGSFLMHKSRN